MMTRCVKKRERYIKKLFQHLSVLALILYIYIVFLRSKEERASLHVDDDNEEISRENQRLSSAEDILQNNMKEKIVRAVAGNDESDVGRSEEHNRRTRKPSIKKNQTDSEQSGSVCGHSWKTDWELIKRGRKPVIQLDSSRFIYPMLINGPNNQLIGLRDTMYLAMRLNRTLIMPHFFKHRTDSTNTKKSDPPFINASMRVDVTKIATLMSVVPFSALRSLCPNGFSDIFYTSYKASHASLERVMEDTGIPVGGQSNQAQAYPRDMETSFTSKQINSSKKFLVSLYDSPGRCALYAFPFRTVGTKESSQMLRKLGKAYFQNHSLKSDLKTLNPDALSDEELYSFIVHSTPRPKFIKEIVDDFLATYTLKDSAYLSAHWRYDPADWQMRCRHEDRLASKGKSFMIEMCQKVKNTEPSDVAKALLAAVRNTEHKSHTTIRAVYFAAPLTMQDFIVKMKSALLAVLEEEGLVQKLKILTQSDLQHHLAKYSSCGELKENFDDIFSQLEMGICSQAVAFLRSPSSSWSKVISEVRVTESKDRYDGNLFDLAWQAASKRMNS